MEALLDRAIPIIFGFILLRGILSVLLGKKKRRRLPEEELPQDGGGENPPGAERDEAAPLPQQKQQPDLAAEFERRLKKTTEESARRKQAEQEAEKKQRVNPVRQDKQRLHHDDEAPHEGKGRIHREGEALAHDKGRVYYDPRGDYSYDEARMNEAAAAFRARYAKKQEAPGRAKVKLKHGALVNGFIMAQVLDKPRGLKAYGAEEQL